MSAFLKNWPVKVLGGTGVYLSEAHSPPMTTYSTLPLTNCTWVLILIHTGKGGEVRRANQREGGGVMLHKAGRKCQHD